MFSSPIIIIWTMTIFAFVLMVPLFGMLSRYAILHGIYDYPDPQYGAPTVMSFFNLFGFVALFLFGIGWGNVIHIDPTRINRPYKTAKTVLAYLATPLLTLAGAIMLLIPGLLISSRACVYAALNLFLWHLVTVRRAHVPIFPARDWPHRDARTHDIFTPYYLLFKR